MTKRSLHQTLSRVFAQWVMAKGGQDEESTFLCCYDGRDGCGLRGWILCTGSNGAVRDEGMLAGGGGSDHRRIHGGDNRRHHRHAVSDVAGSGEGEEIRRQSQLNCSFYLFTFLPKG